MALLLRITSVELGERDFRDVEKKLVALPDGSGMERFVKCRAGARRLNRPNGRSRGRWTDDHEAGALDSVLDAHAQFDAERRGRAALFATDPQWPRLNLVGWRAV